MDSPSAVVVLDRELIGHTRDLNQNGRIAPLFIALCFSSSLLLLLYWRFRPEQTQRRPLSRR